MRRPDANRWHLRTKGSEVSENIEIQFLKTKTLNLFFAEQKNSSGEKNMLFPDYRPRRMRQSEAFRRMIRETHLRVDDLILPLFTIGGEKVPEPDRLHARALPALRRQLGEDRAGGPRGRHPGGDSLRRAGPQGPRWALRRMPPTASCSGRRGRQGRSAGTRRDHRCVPLPVHRPRPLRLRRGRLH